MVDIRIKDLPVEPSPIKTDFAAIDGVSTRKASIQKIVDAGAPVASQAKAEAGVDNNDRMTALTTKQAIDFNSVPLSRAVTAGTGLTGGGSLTSNISLELSSASIASLALADSSVQPSRQLIAGTGLSGGGALSADVTFNLSSATQTSLGLANTAIQDGSNALIPNGGTTGQVLIKNSNANRDTAWSTIAAATAVSYAEQSLNAGQQAQARANISSALRGHIFGLTLSNNSTDSVNDIDISSGEAASTETNPVLMVLSSSLTKRLDAAWAIGSGNGGLDTGTIANTTYHVWLIQRSDTGVIDALFSTSATSPTMPTGYDRKRRIGSILRLAGSIQGFSQKGDRFFLQAGRIIRNTTAAASNILVDSGVPSGLQVYPILSSTMLINANSSASNWVGDGDSASASFPFQANNTGGVTSANLGTSSGDVVTDTSGQIRWTTIISSGSISSNVCTMYGWVDPRGR